MIQKTGLMETDSEMAGPGKEAGGGVLGLARDRRHLGEWRGRLVCSVYNAFYHS